MYDPLHAVIVHSIASRLSERGRRWPFKMGALKVCKRLNELDEPKLLHLEDLAYNGSQFEFHNAMKEVGIE